MRPWKLRLSKNHASAYLHHFAAGHSRHSRVLAGAFALSTAALLTVAFAQAQTTAAPRRSDALRPLPLTAFYDTPQPLPPGKAGELIRAEPFDDYDLPYTVSAVRILYHSRSATGEDVASSGVVLFPTDAKPPVGGWPLVAWAHGATGVARICAPSLLKNLGHGTFFSMYVNLGYAIVATDYAGLGTNFRSAFVDSESNANDVIYAIDAARTAVPKVGTRWVVMGEAEGGLAAAKVAEKENTIHDSGYLGSIIISGFSGAKELYGAPSRDASPHSLLSMAYGIQTVYPQFRVTDVLTQKALPLFRQARETCSGTGVASQLAASEIMKPEWTENRFVSQYFARNSLGEARAYGPILAISGDDEQFAQTATTARAIARMCKMGDQVQWEKYPDQNLGSVIGDSVRDQIAWIESRFAGRAAKSNCP